LSLGEKHQRLLNETFEQNETPSTTTVRLRNYFVLRIVTTSYRPYALWRFFLKGWFHSLYCCKENAGWLTAPLAISGGSRDQMRPSLPTIQFAYRRWPSRQRNERNILGNIL